MPEEKKVSFKSEEERIAAIDALGDDPSKLDQLEEIRNAPIVAEGAEPRQEGSESSKPKEGEEPEKKPEGEQKPPEKKPEENEEEVFTIKRKDLPQGYGSLGHVMKAFGEQRDLISRQGTYIQELARKAAEKPEPEKRAIEGAQEADEKLRQSGGAAGASPETVADISSVQKDIQQIQKLQDELDKQADDDPDIAYTPDYQKKVRDLSRLQVKNLNILTTLLGKAQVEASEAKRTAAEVVAGTQRERETKQEQLALEATYNEVDTLDAPELKLSKSVKEIEGEYKSWADGVAMAFYGRPAANVAEKFSALEQLQNKNPELVSKCQLMGIKTEPTQDIQRYMKLCEYLDYRDGFRKDPATGQYIRLMKYDGRTQTQVPLVLPSLKAAIEQKRIEEGYYHKKADNAFQEGAESISQAAMRRDKGAVELNNGDEQGQTPGGGQKAAYDTLLRIDAEDAMYKFRHGDSTAVEELNKARKALGMEPLTLEE